MKRLFLLVILSIFTSILIFSQESRLIEIKTIDDIEKELREEIENEKKENKKEEKEEVKEENIEEEKKETEKEEKEEKKENIEGFNGKLYREDIFIQDMGSYYIIWIKRKEGVNSVGFVTYDVYTPKKLRYFLRSEKPLLKIDNRLKYKDQLIEKGFLISSQSENHRILGETFKIYLPKKVVIGYDSNKKELLINENTNFIIRVFNQPFGEGKFYDNLYRISLVYNPKFHFKKGLNLLKKSKKNDFYILEFSYLSDIIDITGIGLETDDKYLPLLPEKLTNDAKIIVYNWGYKPGKNRFFINFFVIYRATSDFYLVLKKDKDDIKLKIDTD